MPEWWIIAGIWLVCAPVLIVMVSILRSVKRAPEQKAAILRLMSDREERSGREIRDLAGVGAGEVYALLHELVSDGFLYRREVEGGASRGHRPKGLYRWTGRLP